MATTAVTLAGFPLIGTTPGGGRARLLGFDGWLAGSNTRARARRTSTHGTWSSAGFRAEKPIVASGTIVYPTAAAAATERREMLALGGYSGSQLVVTDSLGTLGQTVEVDDVDIPPVRDSMLRYSFELTATDPFARATSTTTFTVAAGATANPVGLGTVAAEIEVTLTSGGTVDLTAGGLAFRSNFLPAGTVITSGHGFVNPPRSVMFLGVDLFGDTLPGTQWPAVIPGANSFVNAGTAALSVAYYPTYA